MAKNLLTEEQVENNPALLRDGPIIKVGLCKQEKLDPEKVNDEIEKIENELVEFE